MAHGFPTGQRRWRLFPSFQEALLDSTVLEGLFGLRERECQAHFGDDTAAIPTLSSASPFCSGATTSRVPSVSPSPPASPTCSFLLVPCITPFRQTRHHACRPWQGQDWAPRNRSGQGSGLVELGLPLFLLKRALCSDSGSDRAPSQSTGRRRACPGHPACWASRCPSPGPWTWALGNSRRSQATAQLERGAAEAPGSASKAGRWSRTAVALPGLRLA